MYSVVNVESRGERREEKQGDEESWYCGYNVCTL